MKILVVGAVGDIGQTICAELGARHELIRAGRETPAEPPTGFVVRQYERMRRSASHVDAVRGLDESSASAAARWLKQIADASATRMAAIFRA
jgi:uncharacterized protein YbjT (DUF2867 family)